MAGRSKTFVPKGAAVIGGTVAAVQAALALARMGVGVKLITRSAALSRDSAAGGAPGKSPRDRRYLWPLFLRAAGHPLITLYSNATVAGIEGEKGNFRIQVWQEPRYVNEELCTACGRCEAECSVRLTSISGGRKITRGAIHTPLPGTRSAPSAYMIDKNGSSPCQVACPLGINVQGFVSLLSRDKTDKALALINEAAPLAGILGRVCTHPCEHKCNRAEYDSPVSIRALHRYAADNTAGGIKYSRKSPARSRQGKVAIVGSGPAGLTAAWELTRRGYSPTLFESHGVIGGMLATGIPRFRLPLEVREREIEAIRNLGVDIRTGITIGRDITYTYLKERGYQALFLAIGTQQNNRLNIPGEEADDVVDCLSLLLALNLKLDTFVGLNVAVIGGGNAAIDTARSTLRAGAKEVTVFYRRSREEMPANAEEIEEAIEEGVRIEFNTVPVEILTAGGRVTGIHGQRTRMTDEIGTDGRRRQEMIPDTDFLTDADHVVMAIGQSPDASQLRMAGLEIDSDTGIIRVNPLTLETSLPGVFAGGDCITGPNNVVDAMAAGLRAAESIDRYIQGKDIEAERSPEQPQIAGIDLETIAISPYERAKMPVLRPQKRLHTYEETTLGLPARAARRESERCLNCALCSQCLECSAVCELGAVCHDDTGRHYEIEVEAILSFPGVSDLPENARPGIHTVFPDSDTGLAGELAQAMAAAFEAASELEQAQEPAQDAGEPGTDAGQSPPTLLDGGQRLGVFLCSCGGSISSVINFRTVSRKLSAWPGVSFIHEIAQACTEDGARQIAEKSADQRLGRVVLAACRCCNLEQVCYTCTDRRQMCQQYLYQHLIRHHHTLIEFCNIREQCAWAHQDEPEEATHKALQIISAGVARAQMTPPIAFEEGPILPSILVLGGGLVNVTAARALASRGYRVEMVSRGELDIAVKPWPDALQLHGSAGNYEAVLKYGAQSEHINTGAVLVDIAGLDKEAPALRDTFSSNDLLSRILSRSKKSGLPSGVSLNLLREITIGEHTGIFVLSPDDAASPDERVRLGLATAARISAFLEPARISPRANAVNIASQRCRGCGDCAVVCPYIEMRHQDGTACAFINKTLCLGCGACIAVCPTGAITQTQQSDQQIIATLSSMLVK